MVRRASVGKSLVARLLAQFLIDHSIPFLGFDSDRSHGALLRFYADYASPVLIDDYYSLDAIVEAATVNPDRRILVDLAAQTQERLTQWMQESQLLEVAPELGLNICYWHVMDTGRDSVDLLKRLLDRHGAYLKYVLSAQRSSRRGFSHIECVRRKERALGLGAKVMALRRLHETSMIKIDAVSASFWAVANNGEPHAGGLGLLERQRVRNWLKNAFAEIAKLDV